MTPTSGEPGTVVTITGANFHAATPIHEFQPAVQLQQQKELVPRVLFNGVEAEHVWIDSPYQIRASVLLATTGPVRVVRQGLGAEGRLEDKASNEQLTFTVSTAPPAQDNR